MPFADDSFDAIISKASLSKLVNSSWEHALGELARVTKSGGVWYVAPHYMSDRLVENMPAHVKKILTDKSVNFCSWTWDTEDSRNRYWRNKGIITDDAAHGHDINYEKRDRIGKPAREDTDE